MIPAPSLVRLVDTTVIEETSIPKRRRKSSKKATTCIPCQKRKLKCDRGLPCGACSGRGPDVSCTWAEGTAPLSLRRPALDSGTMMLKRQDFDVLLAQTDRSSPSSQKSQPFHPTGITATLAQSNLRAEHSNQYSQPTLLQPLPTWRQKTEKEMEREWKAVLTQMPDHVTIRALLEIYFNEVAWMHRVVTQSQADKILAHSSGLPRIKSSGHYTLNRPSELIKIRLSHAALISAICASAIIFGNYNQEISDRLTDIYGSKYPSAYGVLLDTSYRALNALDLDEDPTLDSVRTLVLITYCMSAIRSPASGISALWQAIRIAFSLRLDCDPVNKYANTQAADRAQLFATLCILDWLHAGDVKRHFLISPDNCNITHHFAIESSSEIIPNSLRIKLAIGSISRKVQSHEGDDGGGLQSLTQLNTELRVLKNMCLRLDRSGDNKLQVLGLEMSIEWQLLKLHQPYYARGWKEEQYRFSKDTSVSIALSIVEKFHAAFFWLLPRYHPDVPPRQPTAQEQVYTRVWLLSHSCIAASIFLLEHAQFLDMYPDQKGKVMREQIFEDLVTTRSLLQTIASRSAIATNGISALDGRNLAKGGTCLKGKHEIVVPAEEQNKEPRRQRGLQPSLNSLVPLPQDKRPGNEGTDGISDVQSQSVVGVKELIPNSGFRYPSPATADFINKLDYYVKYFSNDTQGVTDI